MKRVYCLTAFILLLFLPVFLSAQLPKGVVIANGKGSGNLDLQNEFNPQNPIPELSQNLIKIKGCNLVVRFRVIVFNLDELNGDDYSNIINVGLAPNLDLPDEYEPMFLRCELNGIVDVVEVESFSFVRPENGPYAFVFDHYMNLDYCDYCDSDSDYILQSHMNLESEDGSVYPICNYTEPGDLFACNYLPGGCSMTTCNNEDWANWSSNIIGFSCGEDFEDGEIINLQNYDGITNDSEARNSSIQKKESLMSPIIYPNPFQSELNIQWKSESENSTIRMYSTNGQLVKSWYDTGHRAEEILKVDINTLPNGIYFLEIQSEGEILHHKLIKAL